jgi:hypothetical protein
VRLSPRQTLVGLAIVALLGVPAVLASYLSLGLWFAPPWPVAPINRDLTPLVADALWARANGGANTDLDPFGPGNLAQLVFCIAQAEREAPGERRDDAQAECRRLYAPGFEAVEYLSGLHMRSAGYKEPGFREGHARFVTTIWMTRAWDKDDLMNALAGRGEFGMGFRGLGAAAQGYFGLAVSQLTLPQAATLAAFIGGQGPDPWCDAATAATRRHRVLSRMRDNGAIDEPAFNAADRAELGLAPAPSGHPGCNEVR